MQNSTNRIQLCVYVKKKRLSNFKPINPQDSILKLMRRKIEDLHHLVRNYWSYTYAFRNSAVTEKRILEKSYKVSLSSENSKILKTAIFNH